MTTEMIDICKRFYAPHKPVRFNGLMERYLVQGLEGGRTIEKIRQSERLDKQQVVRENAAEDVSDAARRLVPAVGAALVRIP